MKRFLILSFIILNFYTCKNDAQHKEDSNKDIIETTHENLKVMTYNIRLDVASDGENAWPYRKDILTSQIVFHSPHIIGVQEARPNQMADLKSVLKDYKSIGIGRDGDNKGEFSAIFYNSKNVTVENENTFWLSSTPDEVSKGWDAAYPRICTYGLFTYLKNNKKFWVFNTHLDHVGAQAQLKGIDLILDTVKNINSYKYPVILMGDFNAEPGSELITNLKGKMYDTKDLSKVKFGPNGTFNGFKIEQPVTRRIDYIMVSKYPEVEVKKYGVLSNVIDLKYPSDHFPVFVELNF